VGANGWESKVEIRKLKMGKKEFTQRALRKNTEITEKKAATSGGERASILAKAEPRPVEDEVVRPAAAFDC
jgi:hypothetical protein